MNPKGIESQTKIYQMSLFWEQATTAIFKNSCQHVPTTTSFPFSRLHQMDWNSTLLFVMPVSLTWIIVVGIYPISSETLSEHSKLKTTSCTNRRDSQYSAPSTIDLGEAFSPKAVD